MDQNIARKQSGKRETRSGVDLLSKFFRLLEGRSPGFGARTGFTLMELLVVIAIIAVLAVVISPSLTSARRSAKSAQCANNLKILGQAGQLYSAEHDGQIVMFMPFTSPVWTVELAPYLQMAESKVMSEVAGGSNPFICPEAPNRFGYGHNYSYLGAGFEPNPVTYKQSQIARPASTVFLVDAVHRGKNPPTWPGAVRAPEYGGGRDLDVEFRHPGEKANVLWLDGHVSAEEEDTLMKDDTLWDRM